MSETIRVSYTAQSTTTVKTHYVELNSSDKLNADYPDTLKLLECSEGRATWWEFEDGFAPDPSELEWMGISEEKLIEMLKGLIVGEVGELTFAESIEQRESVPYYNNPDEVARCRHLGYHGKTICGVCGGILKEGDR